MRARAYTTTAVVKPGVLQFSQLALGSCQLAPVAERLARPCRSESRLRALASPARLATRAAKRTQAYWRELAERNPLDLEAQDQLAAQLNDEQGPEAAARHFEAVLDVAALAGVGRALREHAFGRQVDSFESEVDLGLAGGPLHAVFIRAPWVEEAGEEVEVLGRVVGGAADGRIVAVRQGNLVATSFHPELTGDRRVHRPPPPMAPG